MKIFTALLIMLFIAKASAADNDRQRVSIEMAKQAISTALLNGKSSAGRTVCKLSAYACTGPDKAELGLAILESIKTDESADALLEVSAFKIDAGLSEEHACALIANKELVSKALRKASPQKNREKCISRFASVIRSTGLYNEIEPSSMCKTTQQIISEYTIYPKMLKSSCP